MLRKSFTENFKCVEEVVFESKILNYAKNTNLSKDALAQILTQSLNFCLQSALNLEELELKAKSEAMNLEKMRTELELAILNSKASIKQANAEAMKSVIQAKSMLRSVKDNAAINKTNAYVGFLNVVGNASEQAAIKPHTNNVIATINQIDTSSMPASLNAPLDRLLDSNEYLGSKEVMIHAPKLLLEIGEYIELKGFSSLGEAPCRFVLIKDKTRIIQLENSKSYLLAATHTGSFIYAFEVFDSSKNKWIKDEIEIEVVEKR